MTNGERSAERESGASDNHRGALQRDDGTATARLLNQSTGGHIFAISLQPLHDGRKGRLSTRLSTRPVNNSPKAPEQKRQAAIRGLSVHSA